MKYRCRSQGGVCPGPKEEDAHECFALKEINKVKSSNFTVVPQIHIIDEGHGVTFVQSVEKQSIVVEIKVDPKRASSVAQ